MITDSPHLPFPTCRLFVALVGCFEIATFTIAVAENSQSPDSPPAIRKVASPTRFCGLEAHPTADSKGGGTGIKTTPDGAYLHTDFQKLAGNITTEGLWLESTDKGGGRLRLTASAIGRDDSNHPELPKTGSLSVGEKTVVFARPGLTEEYSVSMDGVRQDFIVAERAAGSGVLQVDLSLSGARAETAADGAKLILDDSGRELIYNRLRVVDAAGRTLAATLQVLAADHLAVRVDDTAAVYPVRIDPTFSDADWVSLNPGMPGANGEVTAIAIAGGGNVYIGGLFTAVGTVAANRVAKWDGSNWSSLGSGLNENGVSDLLVSGGDLYVSGSFTAAGGVPANHIAKWNGVAWSALGEGVGSYIYSLVMSGGNLYAGGALSIIGIPTSGFVSKWNGSIWSAVGLGMDRPVHSLAVNAGVLYAGGEFTQADGTNARSIARWNGGAWSGINTPGSEPSGTINDMVSDGQNLYVAGNFGIWRGDQYPANGIAKWDGNAWSILGTGIETQINALAMNGGDLYVGGNFKTAGGRTANSIAKWNGSSWSALGTGTLDRVYALAVDGNNLYMGGNFNAAGGVTAQFVAKWDSYGWSALGSGMDGGVSEIATSGADLFVGGSFTTIGGVAANHIAKWDGSTWSALGLGVIGSVSALQVSGTDLYVGGGFGQAGGVPVQGIAKWNGTDWSALGSGVGGRVSALAVMGHDLYAGGVFSTAGGVAAKYIAKWDGTTWSALGSGMINEVSALAVSGSDLYAGGYFTVAGGIPAKYIAKWNGSAWSPLGAGMNNSVYSLAVMGTDIYAGGGFSTAGGIPASCIAKWNGTEWSALGSGTSGTYSNVILALAVNGSALYAGGDFETAGGVSGINNIAEWTGSEWLSIGSGVNGRVSALAASTSSQLFVGGSFTLAGTTVSPYVVQADNLLATPLFRVLNGVTPLTDGSGSPVSFGSLTVGTSSSKTFTVTNSGKTDLTLAPIGSDGANAADFVVGTPASSTVMAGSSTTFTVTFAPSGSGLKTASIHIVGTGPYDIPFDIMLAGTAAPIVPRFGVQDESSPLVDGSKIPVNFGVITLGGSSTKTLSITNNSDTGLTLAPISSDGSNTADFVVGTPASSTVAPGASATFTVTFAPSGLGLKTAAIHIVGTGPHDVPFDIALTGTAIPTFPLFGVRSGATSLTDGSESPVSFGSITVGASSSKTFTVTNTGETDLTLAPIITDGANTADFVVGTPASSTVAPGASTTFTVTFTPNGSGLKTAAIHIVGTGTSGVPFDIVLAGTATPVIPALPEIVVEQPVRSNLVDGRAKISFGTVKVGKTGSTKTFTIKNIGAAPLTSISISKDGNASKDFIVTPSGKTTLAPGSSTVFKVKFQPTAKKTRNASIHIRSNDANENKFDIKLTGLGAAN